MSQRRINTLLCLFTISASWGCGDSPSHTPSELVRVESVAPNAHCMGGGLAVSVGADLNGDRVLSDSEIRTTDYVCHGAMGQDGDRGDDGHSTLLTTTDLPVGADCPAGGVLVSSGVDLNSDGVLDEAEVSSTEIVCNGVDGRGGASLVSVVEEPPGEACAAGGQAVYSGVDSNGDGLLQPEEATSTSFVCNGQDGLASLIRQVDANARDCAFGGRSVLSGLDDNRDGYLDDAEIDAKSAVCNGEPAQASHSSLFLLTDEEEGEPCAAGGYRIDSGLDTNDDGVLDSGEITNTEHICHGLAGRDGLDGRDGASGLTSLVLTQDEAPGPHCAAGGIQIDSGLDTNSDGNLDADEFAATYYVCHGEEGSAGVDGAEGLNSLVATLIEPTGPNCTTGGVRVDSGLDIDADGTLGTSEITSTRFVCNGEDGADGADGLNALVATTPEPPGVNCMAGGTRFASGLDTNANSTLDAGEVTSTRYVCNGLDGSTSLVVTSPEPPGSNCASGGQRIQSGTDADQNGLLSSGEVERTSYVCHGGNVLLRATNAAWGGVCQRGGVRIDTGLDDNGNGTLDDPEVDRTQYVCNLFFVHMALGGYHSCAVISDSTVRCWGRNAEGQLGDGTTTSRSRPAAVSGLLGVVELTGGWTHTCARLNDGTARCWGAGFYGQLGNGTGLDRTTPRAVSDLTTIVELTAGTNHTCARLTDGTVWCWGSNSYGQIGDGTRSSRRTPTNVVGLSNAAGLTAGTAHTCARLTDGTAQCWGQNSSSQLGNGSSGGWSTEPVTVQGLTNAIGISAGGEHSCALLGDGTAQCWGAGSSGRLGTGEETNENHPTPVAVSGLVDVVELTSGDTHSCALLESGAAQCWGYNGHGRLGDGTEILRRVPTYVLNMTNAVEIDAGASHTCVRLSDGTAQCWGQNSGGCLGDGTGTRRLVPTPVLGDLAL